MKSFSVVVVVVMVQIIEVETIKEYGDGELKAIEYMANWCNERNKRKEKYDLKSKKRPLLRALTQTVIRLLIILFLWFTKVGHWFGVGQSIGRSSPRNLKRRSKPWIIQNLNLIFKSFRWIKNNRKHWNWPRKLDWQHIQMHLCENPNINRLTSSADAAKLWASWHIQLKRKEMKKLNKDSSSSYNEAVQPQTDRCCREPKLTNKKSWSKCRPSVDWFNLHWVKDTGKEVQAQCVGSVD